MYGPIILLKIVLIFSDEQMKAQQQIDEVCGNSRKPRLSEKSKLTRIEAIMWESLRIINVCEYPRLISECRIN